jgi:hypothetical protein
MTILNGKSKQKWSGNDLTIKKIIRSLLAYIKNVPKKGKIYPLKIFSKTIKIFPKKGKSSLKK